MAAPLVSDGRVLGVLEVLDPSPQARSGLPELDLLALFARQAATALRVVSPDPPAALPPSRRADALRLLGSLEQLLRESA